MPANTKSSTPSTLRRIVNKRTENLVRCLAAHGQLIDGVGQVADRSLSLSVASHIGSSDKESNDDSAFIWVPTESGQIHWVASVADGVSASWWPELASRLACLSGMAAVASNKPLDPIQTASKTLRTVGNIVAKNPSAYPDERASTWRRIIDQGCLLQTTLMVAWETKDALHLTGIGDGAWVIDDVSLLMPTAFVPSDHAPVNALGAFQQVQLTPYRHTFRNWSSLSVFTDGFTHCLNGDWELLSPATRASDVINQILSTRAERVKDNLSLFRAEKGTQA